MFQRQRSRINVLYIFAKARAERTYTFNEAKIILFSETFTDLHLLIFDNFACLKTVTDLLGWIAGFIKYYQIFIFSYWYLYVFGNEPRTPCSLNLISVTLKTGPLSLKLSKLSGKIATEKCTKYAQSSRFFHKQGSKKQTSLWMFQNW